MQAVVETATLVGVRAVPVEVQADVSNGLPSFSIVGLGDAAVMEARERVRSAIRASGLRFPEGRVTVNLAPAPLRKHGTGFDLPIAVALLTATGQVPAHVASRHAVVGELALDGSVRPVAGMLAHALTAGERGLALLGPAAAAAASIGALPDVAYDGVRRLADVVNGEYVTDAVCELTSPEVSPADLADVVGHEQAKRALTVAAAGGHNILLTGPPGSGKTMLARRLPGILPGLTPRERMQTALVHSVAGLDTRSVLAGVRPFRAPHHSCSTAGLVGGGTPPLPGEVSLAHNGVLFLDEFAEFSPAALQTLRQPMEDGRLTLVRAEARVTYPAGFTLVAAMNPCPCGFLGDPGRHCRCSDVAVDRYRARIGGPLMDRLDLLVRVDRVDPAFLVVAEERATGSADVREVVLAARRFGAGRPAAPNARLDGPDLLRACGMNGAARSYVTRTARTCHLSGRGIVRLLKVARTLADLAESETVRTEHLAEAVSYRGWET